MDLIQWGGRVIGPSQGLDCIRDLGVDLKSSA